MNDYEPKRWISQKDWNELSQRCDSEWKKKKDKADKEADEIEMYEREMERSVRGYA